MVSERRLNFSPSPRNCDALRLGTIQQNTRLLANTNRVSKRSRGLSMNCAAATRNAALRTRPTISTTVESCVREPLYDLSTFRHSPTAVAMVESHRSSIVCSEDCALWSGCVERRHLAAGSGPYREAINDLYRQSHHKSQTRDRHLHQFHGRRSAARNSTGSGLDEGRLLGRVLASTILLLGYT